MLGSAVQLTSPQPAIRHKPPFSATLAQVLSLVLVAGVGGGAAYGIARVDAGLLGAGEDTLDGVQVRDTRLAWSPHC